MPPTSVAAAAAAASASASLLLTTSDIVFVVANVVALKQTTFDRHTRHTHIDCANYVASN